jgi:hypothetical protein
MGLPIAFALTGGEVSDFKVVVARGTIVLFSMDFLDCADGCGVARSA